MYEHNGITIARLDSRNYVVENGKVTRYFPRIDQAVKEVARQDADSASDLYSWLERYEAVGYKIAADLRGVSTEPIKQGEE